MPDSVKNENGKTKSKAKKKNEKSQPDTSNDEQFANWISHAQQVRKIVRS